MYTKIINKFNGHSIDTTQYNSPILTIIINTLICILNIYYMHIPTKLNLEYDPLITTKRYNLNYIAHITLISRLG